MSGYWRQVLADSQVCFPVPSWKYAPKLIVDLFRCVFHHGHIAYAHYIPRRTIVVY